MDEDLMKYIDDSLGLDFSEEYVEIEPGSVEDYQREREEDFYDEDEDYD